MSVVKARMLSFVCQDCKMCSCLLPPEKSRLVHNWGSGFELNSGYMNVPASQLSYTFIVWMWIEWYPTSTWTASGIVVDTLAEVFFPLNFLLLSIIKQNEFLRNSKLYLHRAEPEPEGRTKSLIRRIAWLPYFTQAANKRWLSVILHLK